jgi:malonyl-ACP O-methyltransferase BioC
MAEKLCEAIQGVAGSGASLGHVLELGCGTGLFTRMLVTHFRVERWTGNDIVCDTERLESFVRGAGVREVSCIHADMETCDFGSGWNVICANASFQWLMDPYRFIGGLPRVMEPDGLLAYATFGPDNMHEMATVTGNGLRYATMEQHLEILARDSDVLVATEFRCRLSFDSPVDVLRHIKATGTNALAPGRWSRRDLEAFCLRYREQLGGDGEGVHLTYHPMLFVARVRTGRAR